MVLDYIVAFAIGLTNPTDLREEATMSNARYQTKENPVPTKNEPDYFQNIDAYIDRRTPWSLLEESLKKDDGHGNIGRSKGSFFRGSGKNSKNYRRIRM